MVIGPNPPSDLQKVEVKLNRMLTGSHLMLTANQKILGVGARALDASGPLCVAGSAGAVVSYATDSSR